MSLGRVQMLAALDLRDRGCSIRTIAALVGASRSAVGAHLRGYGETAVDIRCEHCGRPLVARISTRRYCGNACRSEARRARMMERDVA